MKRTKAVVAVTTAKNATPNTTAESASIAADWLNSGSAAPTALNPRMIAVLVPLCPRASTPRQTHGEANALKPIRHQKALCAAALPPASRTNAIMNVM